MLGVIFHILLFMISIGSASHMFRTKHQNMFSDYFNSEGEFLQSFDSLRDDSDVVNKREVKLSDRGLFYHDGPYVTHSHVQRKAPHFDSYVTPLPEESPGSKLNPDHIKTIQPNTRSNPYTYAVTASYVTAAPYLGPSTPVPYHNYPYRPYGSATPVPFQHHMRPTPYYGPPTPVPYNGLPHHGPSSPYPNHGPVYASSSPTPYNNPPALPPYNGHSTTTPYQGYSTPSQYQGPSTPSPYFGPSTPAPFHGPPKNSHYYGPTTPSPYYGPITPSPYYGPTTPSPYYGPTTPSTYYGPTTPAPYHGPSSPLPYHGPSSPSPYHGHSTPPANYGSPTPKPNHVFFQSLSPSHFPPLYDASIGYPVTPSPTFYNIPSLQNQIHHTTPKTVHSHYSKPKPLNKAPAISFLDSPQPHQPKQHFIPQSPALLALPDTTNQKKQSAIKEPQQQLKNVISFDHNEKSKLDITNAHLTEDLEPTNTNLVNPQHNLGHKLFIPQRQHPREQKSFEFSPSSNSLENPDKTAFPIPDKNPVQQTLFQSINQEAPERPVHQKLTHQKSKHKMPKSDALQRLMAIAGDDWDVEKGIEKNLLDTSSSSFICPSPEGDFPSPSSCSVYYQCAQGTPHKHTCEAGLRWNMDKNQCDWEHNVDCDRNKSSHGYYY